MTNNDEFDHELIINSSGFCDKCEKPLFNELLISEFNNYSCWKCNERISIIQVSAVIDENDKLSYHERLHEGKTYFLDYLTNDAIGELVQQKFPLFYKDHSKTVEMDYYMNHCKHCNAKQGDFFVYTEWLVEIAYEEDMIIKTTKLRITDEQIKYFITGKKTGNDIECLEFLCENCYDKK